MAEKYTKGLVTPTADDLAERDRRQIEFLKNRKELNLSPAEGSGDLNKTLVGEGSVEKLNEIQPQKTGADFKENIEAKLAARKAAIDAAQGRISDLGENVYDAAEMKRQYLSKAKDVVKKMKSPKSVGGFLGGIAAATMLPESAQASVPVRAGMRALDEGDPTSFLLPAEAGPQSGSFDQRLESGDLSPEEKQQLLIQQARIKALRGM